MLDKHGVPYSMIRQKVNNREAQKDAFKDGRNPVFLLGLKAGGRGADLPEADTVIHVDPWWNPKAHDQATDRAHRMGQKNTVLNLRLFIEGSFEERVMEIQERKRIFADSLDDETVLDESKITEDDVRAMLRPLQEVDNEEEALAD
jgi:SNF2 family DNA or RNA helicase